MTPLHKLSPEMQDAIGRQVSRIKLELGISSELLSLEELAAVAGKKINYLWNLRNKGQMLPIPVTKVGGHDTYWIVHVVQWMMGADIGSSAQEANILLPPLVAKGKERVEHTKADGELNVGQEKPARQKKNSVAKAALLERGLKILAQRSDSAKSLD